MNRKNNIAARIEKNRIALLRLVFCWLATAYCFNAGGDKVLPRRLAKWVNELLSKAEKATGYLLIAIFYQGQIERRLNLTFERVAMNYAASNHANTGDKFTICGIIKRLKALHRLLHNLRPIARKLAKTIAAKALVVAMKLAALAFSPQPILPHNAWLLSLEKAVPP